MPEYVEHTHTPIFRVVRASWPDPLDASFSQGARNNRWNDARFPALYCCCSEAVARGVTRDILRFAGVEATELSASVRPRLVEIAWAGRVVDVATAEGVAAAGFGPRYPEGASKVDTRGRAAAWHDSKDEGVLCRSASLQRLGLNAWAGNHERWSELALFVRNVTSAPHVTHSRDDLTWFTGP